MTVDVGSYTNNGQYTDRPGTFVFVDCKKRHTLLLVQ